ncbi:hypothetical protein G9A89_012908 [Geosiphon pyriformis]|nr:hypothetical protein G9A89_012908 [Geosiphon pyriformis]
MPAYLLDIEQELLQKVQVLIEHVDIDKFEPLFTYALEDEIVDFINNKYSKNSNANEDLEITTNVLTKRCDYKESSLYA